MRKLCTGQFKARHAIGENATCEMMQDYAKCIRDEHGAGSRKAIHVPTNSTYACRGRKSDKRNDRYRAIIKTLRLAFNATCDLSLKGAKRLFLSWITNIYSPGVTSTKITLYNFTIAPIRDNKPDDGCVNEKYMCISKTEM